MPDPASLLSWLSNQQGNITGFNIRGPVAKSSSYPPYINILFGRGSFNKTVPSFVDIFAYIDQFTPPVVDFEPVFLNTLGNRPENPRIRIPGIVIFIRRIIGINGDDIGKFEFAPAVDNNGLSLVKVS